MITGFSIFCLMISTIALIFAVLNFRVLRAPNGFSNTVVLPLKRSRYCLTIASASFGIGKSYDISTSSRSIFGFSNLSIDLVLSEVWRFNDRSSGRLISYVLYLPALLKPNMCLGLITCIIIMLR